MKKETQKGQRNKFMRFSGMALQMGSTIFIGVFIGTKLDQKYPNKNSIYTLICTLLFLFAALFTIIKQAIKLGNDD